jgi:hypothetical protein
MNALKWFVQLLVELVLPIRIFRGSEETAGNAPAKLVTPCAALSPAGHAAAAGTLRTLFQSVFSTVPVLVHRCHGGLTTWWQETKKTKTEGQGLSDALSMRGVAREATAPPEPVSALHKIAGLLGYPNIEKNFEFNNGFIFRNHASDADLQREYLYYSVAERHVVHDTFRALKSLVPSWLPVYVLG